MDQQTNIPDIGIFSRSAEAAWEITGEGIRRKIMAYGEKGMAAVVEFEKGSVGAVHRHPHLQISFIHAGSFEVTIGGTTRVLNAGDCFHVPSNVDHGVLAKEAGILVDFFHPMREDFIRP